jgi:ornithine cyclodeaminase/alanine dehydrogenase-like protein (mu-crystallin family)
VKTVLILTIVAALGLTAAGCGGTSRNKAYSGSKQDYAAALDSICSATNLAGTSLDLSSITNIAANGGKAKDLLSSMVDKVDKLEPPADVKDSAKSFVDGLRQEADRFGELTQAAKDGDAAKVKSIQGDLQSEAAATSEDARFIGATGCARLFS